MKMFRRPLLALAGLLGPASLSAQTLAAPADPAAIAQSIGEKVLADTVFRLGVEPAPGMQQGFYPILGEPGDKGSYLLFAADVRCTEKCALPVDLRYAASPGELRFLIDGREVFRTQVDRPIEPHELDYNVVDAPIAQRDLLAPNPRRLVIIFRPSSDGGYVIPGLTLGNGSGAQDMVSLAAPGPVSADRSVRFLRARAGSEVEIPSILKELDSASGSGWRPVRPVERMENPDPLDMSDWRYFSGALQSAMLATADRFNRPDFEAYVARHAAFFLENVETVRTERSTKHQLDGPFAHFFRFSLLDDIGPQSAALIEWNARLPVQSRVQFIESLKHSALDAISKVPRLPDGTMARITPESGTVWADDLFMGAASLARIAAVYDRPDLLNEAARQALLFDRHLRDKKSGLYFHGWFDRSGKPSSSKWARANGWTMLAKFQILKELPQDHPDRKALLRIFEDHARALKKVQSANGRWHQVLDNDQTYLETSATAMFVVAMAEGVNRGWLKAAEFDPSIERGWRALAEQVRPDGRVEGIVAGTPILPDDDAYNRQKTRPSDPRGLPAMLYACNAVADWKARHGSAPQKGQ